MKLKTIINYLFIAVLAMQLVSCDNKETLDSPFNATPTERLNAQQKELNDMLESSEFGWKAVYYTDTTQLGGFTHVFKFKDGKVDMASDFDDDTAVYSSEYSIDLGSTVSLVFTTKNRIHLLSDSNNYPVAALRGKGYKGDFQFLYYGQENGQIIFKTNRSFEELRFVKATASDWTDLAKNRLMIANVVGATTRPLFRLLETNDGTKTSQFDFNFTAETRYAVANSIETGSSMSYNMGIAYTPTGILVSPAVKVGNQQLAAFTYDAATGNFIATGTAGVTATIKYSNKPLVLTDDYKVLLAGNPRTIYAYIAAFLATAPSNSLLCNSLLNTINASLPSTQKVNRVSFYFNDGANGSYISYSFTGGKSTLYHFVTVTEDPVNKTIILKDDGWLGGSEPTLLKDLDKQLLDPKGLYVKKESFKIAYSNTIYTLTTASNNFRITTYGL
ncbi:DUF4302 domain-containing protein [Flavobacterium degerlachei]|jgi:hypothetical protein|uniref:DUF4302 domain-containing protein n=1 Tax=Flavobacterium degerlachei TaxID=229203 RepID=A0A1H3DVB9_9FLAO|nr:DUF4302 domain-containing protein [Flavobacterium degerlachei]SDX69559.1 protein of unknown function [Flavobacterium degerlachei]